MSAHDRRAFWNDLPGVRVVTAHADGSLTGHERIDPQVFGGHIPNVGDVIGDVWGDKEYDFQVVQRRYFIREFQGGAYWLLVVRGADPNNQFDEVSNNVLLATDLYALMQESAPVDRGKRRSDEILARIAQLNNSPAATKNFRPKSRHK